MCALVHVHENVCAAHPHTAALDDRRKHLRRHEGYGLYHASRPRSLTVSPRRRHVFDGAFDRRRPSPRALLIRASSTRASVIAPADRGARPRRLPAATALLRPTPTPRRFERLTFSADAGMPPLEPGARLALPAGFCFLNVLRAWSRRGRRVRQVEAAAAGRRARAFRGRRAHAGAYFADRYAGAARAGRRRRPFTNRREVWASDAWLRGGRCARRRRGSNRSVAGPFSRTRRARRFPPDHRFGPFFFFFGRPGAAGSWPWPPGATASATSRRSTGVSIDAELDGRATLNFFLASPPRTRRLGVLLGELAAAASADADSASPHRLARARRGRARGARLPGRPATAAGSRGFVLPTRANDVFAPASSNAATHPTEAHAA